jgi:hypothetical protein
VITLDGIGSGGGAKLELRNGTISGNRNENIYTGGGIDILGYHNFIISGGNISDNHGYIGGGIYENAGIITMTGGNIINNDAGIGGGIYITHGLFIMKDGNITENTAYTLANGLGGGGGGVYADGTFNMTGGTISKNSATGIYGDGGGVYAKSNFTMSGGAISGNTANNQYGGGVFLRQDSQIIVNFNKTGGIIYGNISNTNKNTANSNTNGHAVYFYNSTTYTNPGSYYRDTTLYIFDNIQTMDTIFPSSSGETLNGWTKK